MNFMELNEDSLTILRSFHEGLSGVPKDAAGILLDFSRILLSSARSL